MMIEEQLKTIEEMQTDENLMNLLNGSKTIHSFETISLSLLNKYLPASKDVLDFEGAGYSNSASQSLFPSVDEKLVDYQEEISELTNEASRDLYKIITKTLEKITGIENAHLHHALIKEHTLENLSLRDMAIRYKDYAVLVDGLSENERIITEENGSYKVVKDFDSWI